MIKKQIKMFLMIFCLLFVSTTAVCWMTPVTAEAASVKQGLVKENGKYYYYAVNKAGKSVKVTEDIISERTEQLMRVLRNWE